MQYFRKFVEDYDFEAGEAALQKKGLMKQYGVYPDSVNITKRCICFVARDGADKVLVAVGGADMESFEGRDEIVNGRSIRVCPLSNSNSRIIRRIFEFTNPTANSNYAMSIGLGDRLGLACAGHLRLIKGRRIFPVLAQQSVRELNLTQRTFEDVLSSAVWAVLQEGYRDGYGADGDHLKTAKEVRQALDNDYTMITLDCIEHINGEAEELSSEEQKRRYMKLGEDERGYWEDKYLNKDFGLGPGIEIHISEEVLVKTVLMFKQLLVFVEDIYRSVIKPYKRDIDFEVSIDETSTSTSPEAHYIIASEIKSRRVEIMSLAPKFCGEFQKGIDYKGDTEQFEKELKYHAAIADRFGYKLSIHSGSDKFSAFAAIGRLTGMRFHLKTAGTNWLEALGVIAKADPHLFLSIYSFALARLNDAKKYYHISTQMCMAPQVGLIARDPLRYLLCDEAVRQVLHVTYGYILCEKDGDGGFIFRDRFFDTLNQNEELYYDALFEHINRHLFYLGIA